MKIYNTNQFEKLKINPIKLNDFNNLDLPKFDKDRFPIIYNAVTDIDGNSYDAVKINGKTWMTSNLRTTKLNDGTELYCSKRDEKDNPYYESTADKIEELTKYGFFYNAQAIETEKLAPKGWHVPTIDEWKDLFMFLSGNDKYNLMPKRKDYLDSHIAKSLCSQTDWNVSNTTNAVGHDQSLNNSTGFNIYPVGYFDVDDCIAYGFGENAYLWSSTKNDIDHFWCVIFDDDLGYVKIHSRIKDNGRNVRCVKDCI